MVEVDHRHEAAEGVAPPDTEGHRDINSTVSFLTFTLCGNDKVDMTKVTLEPFCSSGDIIKNKWTVISKVIVYLLLLLSS